MSLEQIAALCDGARFAPPPLSDVERTRLAGASLAGAPPHVAGDYPEWLDPYLSRVFGDARAEELAAIVRAVYGKDWTRVVRKALDRYGYERLEDVPARIAAEIEAAVKAKSADVAEKVKR